VKSVDPFAGPGVTVPVDMYLAKKVNVVSVRLESVLLEELVPIEICVDASSSYSAIPTPVATPGSVVSFRMLELSVSVGPSNFTVALVTAAGQLDKTISNRVGEDVLPAVLKLLALTLLSGTDGPPDATVQAELRMVPVKFIVPSAA